MIFDVKRKRIRFVSIVTGIIMTTELVIPVASPELSSQAIAQSEQMEFAGSPNGGSEMVNLFTGDFQYSIPLLDVEGYSLVLNYDGNVGMHQDASWVGLGWSLNPGTVNRQMRGLPDDFKGDNVTTDLSYRDYTTTGENFGVGAQLSFGPSNSPLGLSAGLEAKGGPLYNSYAGPGYNIEVYPSLGLSYEFPDNSASKGMSFGVGGSLNANVGLGLKVNSLTGMTVTKSIGVGASLVESGQGGESKFARGANYSIGTVTGTRGGKARFQSGSVSIGYSEKVNRGYDSGGASAGRSTYLSLGTKTYIPSLQMSTVMDNSFERSAMGYFGSATPPSPIPWLWAYFLNETYLNRFELSQSSETNPAYGYCHSHLANNESLMDFNRSRIPMMSESVKMLPTTALTYDVFSVSASGFQADFRAYRNDVGTVRDNPGIMHTTGISNVIEMGVGAGLSLFIPSFKVVYTHGEQYVNARSQGWSDNLNQAYSYMQYSDLQSSEPRSRNFSFRTTGERMPLDETFFNQYGGTDPIRTRLEIAGSAGNKHVESLTNGLRTTGTGEVIQGFPVTNSTQQTESHTMVQYLEAGEAQYVGLDKKIKSCGTFASDGSYTVTESDRVTANRKSHHLSEICITAAGGARYVYGMPVYSLTRQEVTFNVEDNTASCANAFVQYSPGTDNSSSNSKGRNHYYSKKTLPAYAESFLISAVVSPDYSDRSFDGPSPDDFGSYVKFNYTQVYSSANPYKWRTPVNENQAIHAENTQTTDDDDAGFYEYGEKELWYVHSIEGKEYIAEFYISNRDDMHSVTDTDGGIDTNKPAKKLDRIELYHKDDRIKHGDEAVPIKTVHFSYEYSLCRNYPGNKHTGVTYATSGKLTLKNVYFTYGNSEKGKTGVYAFTYGGSNPDYAPGSVDRWNVYKANSCSPSTLSNQDFPYAHQDQASRDAAVAAWSLSAINLPTGGQINVTYESDDYGYVQEKRAMEMIPVLGMGHEDDISSYPSSAESRFRPDGDRKNPNNIVYLDLPQNLTATNNVDAKTEFYEKYLWQPKGGSELLSNVYYRFKVEINPGEENYEYVTGYARIVDYGVTGTAPYEEAWVKLAPVDVNDKPGAIENYKVSPVMSMAWQFVRLYVTRAIFPDQPGTNSLGVDWASLINDLNSVLNNKKFCSTFQEDQSFLRLYSPNYDKLGGGNRVKKITYTDNWEDMKGDADFTYGTEYEYDMPNGRSSGVAAWEPMAGYDLNPYTMPVDYVVKNKSFPDDVYYHEAPFASEHFPAPVIGYRRVKVKSIDHNNVTRNGVGYTIHEYLTHREHPFRVKHTPISNPARLQQSSLIWQILLGNPTYDLLGLSQGYTVFRNDMHGKLSKVTSYNNQGDVISYTAYEYFNAGEKVRVADRDGSYEQAIINRTIEIVADMQKTEMRSKSQSWTAGVQMKGVIPLPVIGLNTAKVYEALITSVITKEVNDYGMVKEVQHYHLGSETRQRNIAYDKHTGDGLITSTTNEFGDKVYNINFPVHWFEGYKGMAQASNTWGNHLSAVAITSGGKVTMPGSYEAEDYFQSGDELYMTDHAKKRLWILDVDTTSEFLYLIDENGDPAATDASVSFQVIRSGCRNMQSASMQQIVQLGNPILGDTAIVIDSVLSSGALEYGEDWQMKCSYNLGCATESYVSCDSMFNVEEVFIGVECDTIEQSDKSSCGILSPNDANPFVLGLLGNWKPMKSYAYRVKREEQSTAGSTNIRENGTFDDFIPFYAWHHDDERWYPVYDADHPLYAGTDTENWLNTSEVVKYDEKGRPVESVDALGIYSSVLFGYGQYSQSLPVAVAANARLGDIAFDGFEDYLYRQDIYADTCSIPGHFSFEEAVNDENLDSTKSHTGLYSLKLGFGEQVSVSRYVNVSCSGTSRTGEPLTGYQVNSCDCIGNFSPRPGKYIIGAWASQYSDTALENFTSPELSVVIKNSGGATIASYNFNPSGPIVDNWQRIEGEITIPSNAYCIIVSLKNDGSNGRVVRFDDLRIHPYRAVFTSIVYDPYSLRKMADLNDYNFASFYEYDEQGMPVRLKVETIEGIRTVTEGRGGGVK
jgi:hypothetical protein